MEDADGNLGAPFALREEWPPLMSRESPDCGGRRFCDGCDRITRSAS
jgi:hypothetical protein